MVEWNVKNFKKYGLLVILFLMVLGGCNQKHTYAFTLYETSSSVYNIKDKETIREVDDVISNIISTSEIMDLKDFEIPKGFSYEIAIDGKAIYKFASGSMIYDEKVYTIENYSQVIEHLKEIFHET